MKEVFEKIRKIFHERVMASELKVRELDDLPFNLRKCYDEMDLEDARTQSFEEALSIVSEVEAEYGNGWIPVESGRKPKADERVLCLHDDGFIDCGELVGKTWCCDMDEYAIDRGYILAWMPLPLPFKEGNHAEKN